MSHFLAIHLQVYRPRVLFLWRAWTGGESLPVSTLFMPSRAVCKTWPVGAALGHLHLENGRLRVQVMVGETLSLHGRLHRLRNEEL